MINGGHIFEIKNQIKKADKIDLAILGSSSTLFSISKEIICNSMEIKPDNCIQAAMPGGTAVDSVVLSKTLLNNDHISIIIFGFDNSMMNEKLANQLYYLGLSDFHLVEIPFGFNSDFFRFVGIRLSKIIEHQQDIKYNFFLIRQAVLAFFKGKQYSFPDNNISVYEYNRRRLEKKARMSNNLIKDEKNKHNFTELSEKGKMRIKGFINQKKNTGCKIIFVRIPMYSGISSNIEIDHWLKKQTNHQVYYLNPGQYLELQDHIDFYNGDHMSDIGRQKVSKLVADFIIKNKIIN